MIVVFIGVFIIVSIICFMLGMNKIDTLGIAFFLQFLLL